MTQIWTVYTVVQYADHIGDAYNVIATKWTDQGPVGATKLVAQFDMEDEARAFATERQGVYDRTRRAMDEVQP